MLAGIKASAAQVSIASADLPSERMYVAIRSEDIAVQPAAVGRVHQSVHRCAGFREGGVLDRKPQR